MIVLSVNSVSCEAAHGGKLTKHRKDAVDRADVTVDCETLIDSEDIISDRFDTGAVMKSLGPVRECWSSVEER